MFCEEVIKIVERICVNIFILSPTNESRCFISGYRSANWMKVIRLPLGWTPVHGRLTTCLSRYSILSVSANTNVDKMLVSQHTSSGYTGA